MRALNKEGQKAFRDWVESLPGNPDSEVPRNLLQEEATSVAVSDSPELPKTVFTKKLELARSLVPIVSEIEQCEIDHDCWPRIWDAMALQFFDSICPVDSEGRWNPKNISHYVYSSDYKVRHRHRIYGPVTLLKNGGTSVEPFFDVEPSIHGEFEEQIGSRQEIAGNPTALAVLRALYVRTDGSGIIKGYTTTKKFPGFKSKLPGAGTLRRFTAICNQLRRTYDLEGIASDAFLDLLPSEFEDWANT